MPTARGTALLLAAALLWAVGRLLGVSALHVIAVASGALVVLGTVSVRLADATVSVRRSMSTTRLSHGGSATVELTLRNDGRIPLAQALVSDRCPPLLDEAPRFAIGGLRPRSRATLRYAVTGQRRGRYRVGPMELRVRDPFGVAQLVRRYRRVDEVVVYPQVERLDGGIARAQHRGSGANGQRRLASAGDEFHTMREYQQGDDLRLIHWASTAHRNRLMVRQQEQPWQAEATVFCDTRAAVDGRSGSPAMVEKSISAAASIARHLADRSYRIRLVTTDDRRVPATERWERVLDRLAEIEPSASPSAAPSLTALRSHGADGLVCAILLVGARGQPVTADPDLRALVQAGRGHSGRIAVLIRSPIAGDRPDQIRAFLRSAGWRVITVAPDQPLVGPWRGLDQVRIRTVAHQPDGR